MAPADSTFIAYADVAALRQDPLVQRAAALAQPATADRDYSSLFAPPASIISGISIASCLRRAPARRRGARWPSPRAASIKTRLRNMPCVRERSRMKMAAPCTSCLRRRLEKVFRLRFSQPIVSRSPMAEIFLRRQAGSRPLRSIPRCTSGCRAWPELRYFSPQKRQPAARAGRLRAPAPPRSSNRSAGWTSRRGQMAAMSSFPQRENAAVPKRRKKSLAHWSSCAACCRARIADPKAAHRCRPPAYPRCAHFLKLQASRPRADRVRLLVTVTPDMLDSCSRLLPQPAANGRVGNWAAVCRPCADSKRSLPPRDGRWKVVEASPLRPWSRSAGNAWG